MLFSSQKEIKDELQHLINSKKKYIVIKGKKNSGKGFLVRDTFASFENTLIFNRSEESDEIYAPFEKAARKSSNILVNQIDKKLIENRDKDYSATQIFFSAVDSVNESIKNKDQYPYFKPNEENFLSQISNKLFRQSKGQYVEEKVNTFFGKSNSDLNNKKICIFLFEEINTWDNNSLILVRKLIEYGGMAYPLISDAKIIFTVSTNTSIDRNTELLIEEILRKCKSISIEMPRLTQSDYYQFIKETNIPFYELTDLEQEEMISFLEEYSNDNFMEIPFMIEELYGLMKDRNYDFVDKSKFYCALQKKLSDIEIPTDKSEEILQYASLMGNTFSSKEMKLVTELSVDEFKSVIDKVLAIKVLKQTDIDQNFRFASILFRELFKTRALKKTNHYYTKLEQIVNQLYPHRYDRRAKYLSNVWDAARKTQDLYFLSLLQRLRNRDELDSSIKDNLTDEYLKDLNLFKEVYNFIDKNEYSNALETLNIIKYGSSSAPIKVERDILTAFCYSKTIDGEKRKEGVQLLERHIGNNLLDTEYSDIYERLLMRLFVMYAHMNQIDKAEAVYDQLMNRFCRYEQENPNIQVKRNTLLRISNTICSEQTSKYHMAEAVSFFKSNQSYEKGTINYFIALCNYSGTMIENGNFGLAFENTQEAKKLTEEHGSISFPRIQILLNNYLISGYLSNNLNAKDCMEHFEKIISEMPKNAERLFFTSNLSIFYALTNQFELAHQTLHKESEVHRTSNDSEGKYISRVRFNLSIFNYLSGKGEQAILEMENHLLQLENISSPGKDQEIQKAEKALIAMKNYTCKFDGEEWLEILLKNHVVGSVRSSNVNQNPDYYRKLGYMFTSLYNWDI